MKTFFTQRVILLLLSFLFFVINAEAGKKKEKKDDKTDNKLETSDFSSFKWRSIGPAFVSGRIADFAVDPNNYAHYFVAAASGNIWKTNDNGITYSPVFDNYGAYSIGALAMDPKNTKVIWAGTGENNHQRALGYGNGIYKSCDDGKSWKNMGLKESRQIGEILIDPRNTDIVYVAAEGSVWGPNEERGVFKTTDGGKTWEKVLYISENTGVANLCFEPGNPDVIYAGAEQRRRRQFTKIGGGPESAFYKSYDAGKTWVKLKNGIPKVDKGGMEIVVAPSNPNIVYVMFEASNGKGGFYRSDDRGASFNKMNSYYSSGQYYSELVVDPYDENKIYSLDTYTKVSVDGGKTWKKLGNKKRHVDDHALWIDKANTKHMNIGGDGGVYETFDSGKTWIHKETLPVTQFYRVNTDNTKPFYWIYGGTQDNNSIGGPSANTSSAGVTSCEWVTTLGGDGFWQAVDPTNPDIVYSAYQYGNIYRYDRKSGERIKIKPMPAKDELTFRWNWDAPFIISHFNPKRLYMASNKVFESNDRGNSWMEISDDITRNENRNKFKVMGKYWPSNAVAKDVSTSQWGTAVALAESPLKEGLLYIGTDDGVIAVTNDNGKNWTKIKNFPDVPEYTYVSDICPSRFDENIVYASFNNLKSDDFKPYLLKSTDYGKTWNTISGDLPDNEVIHTVEQDPVNENMLFVGTEYSFYFTVDGGSHWIKLNNGLPDIAIRDIKIQERENDIAIATFGRGFYIMDYYLPLCKITKQMLDTTKAKIFKIKDALMYIQTNPRYGEGSAVYHAPNPPFGATFTYYVKDVPETLKQKRIKKEKELFKNNEPIPQPTKEELDKEENETGPFFEFTIKNKDGLTVRKLYKKASKGINKITWNLRYMNPSPIKLKNNKYDPTRNADDGMLALPGIYTVTLSMIHNDTVKTLVSDVEFTTRILNNTTLPASDKQALDNFYKEIANLWRVSRGTEKYLSELMQKTEYIRQAISFTNNSSAEMLNKANRIAKELKDIEFTFDGTPAKASWEEVPPEIMPLNIRLNNIVWAIWQSTSSPTVTQKSSYNIVKEQIPKIQNKLEKLNIELNKLQDKLIDLKAPYIPGKLPKF
jgi:photosystem II stability/assembly factor-like uncharacterized protein